MTIRVTPAKKPGMDAPRRDDQRIRAPNRRRHHAAGWRTALAVCMLVALTACGSQNAPTTPDATATAASAATIIASLPTAAALHPKPTRTAAPLADTPLADTPLADTPLADTPVPTAIPVPTAAVEAPAVASDYTVQAGDTLLSIALAHKVSMASIALLNDMGDSQVVKLGQMMHIPAGPQWPDENVFWFVYVVQPGEAVSAIAGKYAVKVDDLVRVNQLADASAIRIGQQLVIPATAPATPSQPTEDPEPRTDEIQAEEESPVSAAPAAAPAVEAEVAQAPDEAAPETSGQAAEAHAAAPRVADVASAAVPLSGDVEGFRAQLLAFYNQVRATAGLAMLSWSPALQQSAQLHAEDCAQRGYCSHVGSDGTDTRMRIARAGYVGSATGENWAWGQTAQQVFEAWFTQEYPSGPHRDNILSTHYSEVGFGIAAASGGYYFIANFGTP